MSVLIFTAVLMNQVMASTCNEMSSLAAGFRCARLRLQVEPFCDEDSCRLQTGVFEEAELTWF